MEVCRVCLDTSNLTNIYGGEENIAENIFLFAGVQVNENDGLPQRICQLCKIELDICINFKKKCESSYRTLIDKNTIETASSVPVKEGNRYTCIICEKDFKWKSNLTVHQKEVHGVLKNPLKNYHCDVCGETFWFIAEFRRHELLHSTRKVFRCYRCKENFLTRASLNKHRYRHRKGTAFSGPLCLKIFSGANKLEDHVQIHSSSTCYVCPVCSKMFASKHTKDLHLQTHENEYKFHCVECNKTYRNKYALQNHIRLHDRKRCIENGECDDEDEQEISSEDLKPQCEICDKICLSKFDFTQHIMEHISEKPHACEHCGNMFRTRSHLKRHVKIHTEMKDFSTTNGNLK